MVLLVELVRVLVQVLCFFASAIILATIQRGLDFCTLESGPSLSSSSSSLSSSSSSLSPVSTLDGDYADQEKKEVPPQSPTYRPWMEMETLE